MQSKNDFLSNPRKKQELAYRVYADAIYRAKPLSASAIQRDGDLLADKELGVDAILTLATGQRMVGQEKFLSAKYASFQSVTIEYLQNQYTGEKGDWFTPCPQFYFVGYANEQGNGFALWILLNWVNVLIATQNGRIVWRDNKNKDGRALASFRWATFGQFPPDCVIAKG